MPLKRAYRISFFTALLGALWTWGWMGSFGGDVAGGHFIIWAMLLPCIAFFISGRIFVAELLSRRYSRFRIFIYPAVWLLGDLIQSLGYLAFPWTYWGYSQYPVLPLVQSASVIGILGVSFLVIAGNSVIADFLYRNKESFSGGKISFGSLKGKIYPAVFFLMMVLLLAAGGIRIFEGLPSSEKTFRVATIQSCISPWADWMRLRFSKLNEIALLSDKACAQKPDLLIWSESATLDPISYHYQIGRLDPFERSVLGYAATRNVPLVTGEIGVEEDRQRNIGYPKNNAMLVNRDGSVAATYSKIHLCPFGEWFPYEKALPWISSIALDMGGSSFVPGTTPTIFSTDGRTFGVLICYEGMFFRLSRYYKNKDVDFIINITNDGWSGSFAGHMQHFAASPFRAAENGIWYIRVGNTGYTAVIDPLGRIEKSIPILEKGFMTADLHPGSRIRTVYSRVGDLFSYCILALFVLLCAVSEYRLFKTTQKGRIS